MAELRTSGYLVLGDPDGKTLEDLEQFCKYARKLGLDGKTKLIPFRQEIFGRIVSWRFPVPVIPKPIEPESETTERPNPLDPRCQNCNERVSYGSEHARGKTERDIVWICKKRTDGNSL